MAKVLFFVYVPDEDEVKKSPQRKKETSGDAEKAKSFKAKSGPAAAEAVRKTSCDGGAKFRSDIRSPSERQSDPEAVNGGYLSDDVPKTSPSGKCDSDAETTADVSTPQEELLENQGSTQNESGLQSPSPTPEADMEAKARGSNGVSPSPESRSSNSEQTVGSKPDNSPISSTQGDTDTEQDDAPFLLTKSTMGQKLTDDYWEWDQDRDTPAAGGELQAEHEQSVEKSTDTQQLKQGEQEDQTQPDDQKSGEKDPEPKEPAADGDNVEPPSVQKPDNNERQNEEDMKTVRNDTDGAEGCNKPVADAGERGGPEGQGQRGEKGSSKSCGDPRVTDHKSEPPPAQTESEAQKDEPAADQAERKCASTPDRSETPPPTCDEANEEDMEQWTLLIPKRPLKEEVEDALDEFGVKNVSWQRCPRTRVWQAVFVGDSGIKCEKILMKLQGLGVGKLAKSSISVLPITVHSEVAETPEKKEDCALEKSKEEPDGEDSDSVQEEIWEKKSVFRESIKSRLLVAQVVESVESNAKFTFDYLMLVLLASMLAALGLVENSSVVLVASMLVSPLMGPILAGTFGTVIQNNELRNLGIRSELKGLAICIVTGFVVGLIPAALDASGADWRSAEEWPTLEMSARGVLRGLVVGVLIALPSGMGVALSVLGGNSGSLVGVAISASLLPPAVNAGMLWSNAIIAAAVPPPVISQQNDASSSLSNNFTSSSATAIVYSEKGLRCPQIVNNAYVHTYFCNAATDSLVLGIVSLLLTILNITCIFITGILILKVKEVAPMTLISQSAQDFFKRDIKVARESYATTKGAKSQQLAKQFLKEYKALKRTQSGETNEGETSEDEPSDVLELEEILQEVESSTQMKEVTTCLPNGSAHKRVSHYLENTFQQAAMDHMRKHAEPYIRTIQPYLTIHQASSTSDSTRHSADFSHLLPPLNIYSTHGAVQPLSPRPESPGTPILFYMPTPRRFHVTTIADKPSRIKKSAEEKKRLAKSVQGSGKKTDPVNTRKKVAFKTDSVDSDSDKPEHVPLLGVSVASGHPTDSINATSPV